MEQESENYLCPIPNLVSGYLPVLVVGQLFIEGRDGRGWGPVDVFLSKVLRTTIAIWCGLHDASAGIYFIPKIAGGRGDPHFALSRQ